MDIYFIVTTFIFGTIIGSFLNVIALRYNTGLGIKGRSKCFSCGYTLAWHDLVPVLSFLAHKGKCRKCKSTISYQYPLVEVATGALFALIFWKFSGDYAQLVTQLIIASLLMVAIIYDMKHRIVPDEVSYIFIFISFVQLWYQGVPDVFALCGVLIAIPFWCIVLISKETWMGGGDAKLAMGIGWLLGISQGLSALTIATWIGAIVGIPLLFIGKKGSTMNKLQLPFAPFLILGMYIVLFSGIGVLYINAFF